MSVLDGKKMVLSKGTKGFPNSTFEGNSCNLLNERNWISQANGLVGIGFVVQVWNG